MKAEMGEADDPLGVTIIWAGGTLVATSRGRIHMAFYAEPICETIN